MFFHLDNKLKAQAIHAMLIPGDTRDQLNQIQAGIVLRVMSGDRLGKE